MVHLTVHPGHPTAPHTLIVGKRDRMGEGKGGVATVIACQPTPPPIKLLNRVASRLCLSRGGWAGKGCSRLSTEAGQSHLFLSPSSFCPSPPLLQSAPPPSACVLPQYARLIAGGGVGVQYRYSQAAPRKLRPAAVAPLK